MENIPHKYTNTRELTQKLIASWDHILAFPENNVSFYDAQGPWFVHI
jgi:hypothetical protein